MDMVGEVRLEASRGVVWDALNDPEILKKEHTWLRRIAEAI